MSEKQKLLNRLNDEEGVTRRVHVTARAGASEEEVYAEVNRLLDMIENGQAIAVESFGDSNRPQINVASEDPTNG